MAVQTIEDLRVKYTEQVREIAAEFLDVLRGTKPSSIQARVQRAAKVATCIAVCSQDLATLVLRGICGVFDAVGALNSVLLEQMPKYFAEKLPQGFVRDKTFGTIEDTTAAAAELRRVCAEAGVMFQALETHPHIS